MNIINNIRNYILEDEFKMIFRNDKLDIINYDTILHVGTNIIKIKYNKGLIIINGSNLAINKLVDDELLISGLISNIEIR